MGIYTSVEACVAERDKLRNNPKEAPNRATIRVGGTYLDVFTQQCIPYSTTVKFH